MQLWELCFSNLNLASMGQCGPQTCREICSCLLIRLDFHDTTVGNDLEKKVALAMQVEQKTLVRTWLNPGGGTKCTLQAERMVLGKQHFSRWFPLASNGVCVASQT